MYINSDRAHFRTWKYHSHHEDCVYHFNRRWGDRDYQFTDVTVGFEFERRQMALSRAYRAMRFSQELPIIKTVKRATVDVQKPTLQMRKKVTGVQTTLFDDGTW